MPESVGGIPFRSWANVPTNAAAWEKLVEEATLEEPVFAGKKKPASGVVSVEQDGRVWVVSPTNEFGGYTNTFPKGKLEKVKLSLKANALKEAYEESGLQVELIAYLCDSDRDSSTTRYYLARRIGGNPADMDWESQATSLVPRGHLSKFVSHLNDKAVLDALDRLLPVTPRVTDLMKSPHLTSGHRILKTVNGFRQRYGSWPTVLRMDRGMANALKKGTLTATAWAMLEAKLKIVLIDKGTLYAEGNGQRFESGAEPSTPEVRERADIWIWGIPLEELLNEHFDFFSRHYAVHR
jgi:ADP-ribose pyrophosphatase YjhB (NUDIX family)